VAAALNSLGITLFAVGEYERALGLGRESLERFRAIRDRRGEAVSLNSVGNVLRCQGRFEAAEESLRLGLDAFRDIGDRRGQGAALNSLAQVALQRGEVERARRTALNSLEVYVDLQIPEGQLDALGVVAAVEAAVGRPEAALRLRAIADRERQRVGAAVLTRDETVARAATLAAAHAALGERERADVLAEARRTRLDDAVAEVLSRRHVGAHG
jgi:tetratricopeptide (TPR) repeat protein